MWLRILVVGRCSTAVTLIPLGDLLLRRLRTMHRTQRQMTHPWPRPVARVQHMRAPAALRGEQLVRPSNISSRSEWLMPASTAWCAHGPRRSTSSLNCDRRVCPMYPSPGAAAPQSDPTGRVCADFGECGEDHSGRGFPLGQSFS